MAALTSHAGSAVSKILAIGNNGSGKTGSLVSLAKAGYKLRILDLDKGTEILAQLLADDPAALARVDVESFSDDFILVGAGALQRYVPKTPLRGFSGAMKCLANWPEHGSPTTWGADTVLVLDSLTFLGKYIQNHVMVMKGKDKSLDPKDFHPSQPDWGDAMNLQEAVLAQLFSDSIKCHVIVTAHITFVQAEGEVQSKGFPSALGSKLPPKVGSYFNSLLFYTNEGVGVNKRRTIQTQSTQLVDCKTPAPGKVEKSYPIETGLADYFKAMHGPLKS